MTAGFGTRWRVGSFKALSLAATVAIALAGTAGVAAAGKNAAIVIDAKTGKVLYANEADARRYPASLTKMMTLYLLFEAIDRGKTSLKSKIKISAHAAAQAPSKLGLKPGQTITVRDAILALVTKSANDIAVAVAEHIGGSERAFAAIMTNKARSIGMSRTTFRNASGLPDPAQVTTARDMATLGRALQEHYPHHYKFFATPSFTFKGKKIANHNRLLGRLQGVNGIKTGYTRASGFNLVTAVTRGERQVVAVVLGGQTGRARDQRMAALINDHMGKASKGPRTAAIIPGPAGLIDEPAALAAAAEAPKPRLRPTLEEELATAFVAPEVLVPTKIPAASLAGANSVFALAAEDADNAAEGDIAAADEEVTAVPAPQPMPAKIVVSGWKIQLSASPTESSALAILDRARAKGGKLLANAAPYTEPVVKGDVTLYRARFGGFDKEDARAACVHLKKQKFACLAISD